MYQPDDTAARGNVVLREPSRHEQRLSATGRNDNDAGLRAIGHENAIHLMPRVLPMRERLEIVVTGLYL
jgi:hypothetical protein